MELTGAVAFSGGTYSITTQAITDDGSALLFVAAKPSLSGIVRPAGFTPFLTLNGVNSTAFISNKTVSAGVAQTFAGSVQVGGVTAGDGIVGYILSDQFPVSAVSGTTEDQNGNNFTVTHVSPQIVAEIGDLIASFVFWNQYPREGYTADSTERWDVAAGSGPSAALGTFTATTSAPGPFTWKSDDPNSPSPDPTNPGAGGGEQSVSATIRFQPSAPGTPEPEISGGGEIPIIEIGTSTWGGFSTFTTGSDNAITLTVLDDEGSPFSDLAIDFSVTGSNSLSPVQATTNASGVASTTLTTPLAGPGTIFASYDGEQINSRSITVGGAQVSLIAAPDDILEGQTLILSGEAVDASGDPLAGELLVFQISGGTWVPVGQTPTVTTAAGTFAFQIQATSVGTLTVSVIVGSVVSPSVQIAVSAVPDPDPDDFSLRLRKTDYTRTKPVKR